MRQLLATAILLLALPAAAQTARVYVTNSAGDSIHVIDPASNKVVQVIPGVEGVRPMAFESAADGSPRRIFVQTSNLNGFAVVDFKERKQVARITLPDRGFGEQERRMDSPSPGIGVAPDGRTLWVTSIGANAV